MSIASYIREDLAARMQSGRAFPMQLTLDSLAGHYHVSFTPVRTAVAELIDEGLLERKPNRRLAMSPSLQARKRTGAKLKLPHPPRNPFDVVGSDLVQHSLRGQSVYLREEVTAETYDVSRSAIRNILHRLAGEGMLDHIPRRGWRLRPFRQHDLRAFIEVRELMELKALQLAGPKLNAGELQRLLDANRLPASADDQPRIDESLHDYFVTTAGNPYITDFFERRAPYYRLLFRWEDHDPAAAIATVCQHREILTAVLKQEWPAARKALSHHILNNHSILSQIAGSREKSPSSS